VSEKNLNLEEILQATLMQHTALSEGDWIEVEMPTEAGGSRQRLQVMELRPEAAVSLLDTDLEADVTPSAEFMERMEAEREAARLAAEQQALLEEEEDRLRAEEVAVRCVPYNSLAKHSSRLDLRGTSGIF
jgi:ubiquitin fusion degradation protein 1